MSVHTYLFLCLSGDLSECTTFRGPKGNGRRCGPKNTNKVDLNEFLNLFAIPVSRCSVGSVQCSRNTCVPAANMSPPESSHGAANGPVSTVDTLSGGRGLKPDVQMKDTASAFAL